MGHIHDIAELTKALAWPAVTITVLFAFRKQAADFALSLRRKLDEAERIKFKIGAVVFELAKEIARAPRARSATRQSKADKQQEFDNLEKRYNDIGIADVDERVAARLLIANRLGDLAHELSMSRTELATSGSEARLVALATLTIDYAAANDLQHLLAASHYAVFNYTRYRIILGLLPGLGVMPPKAKNLAVAKSIVANVENAAPPSASLQRLIDRTSAVIAAVEDVLR